jgi:DNA-binding NtrC family response regulator
VVDDEENLVNLLRGYLEREGFEVSETLDGPSALVVRGGQRSPRKNVRTSPIRRSGASIAAKWPPRSNSDQ